MLLCRTHRRRKSEGNGRERGNPDWHAREEKEQQGEQSEDDERCRRSDCVRQFERIPSPERRM